MIESKMVLYNKMFFMFITESWYFDKHLAGLRDYLETCLKSSLDRAQGAL